MRNELRWAVGDSLLMARRNLRRYERVPQLLVFSTIQPVMFILLFAYVFGGAIRVQTANYIDYLLPGILVQTVLFGTAATAVGLAEDLSSGMIDRYRSLPMSRGAVVAGRIVADTTRNVFVVSLMLAVGLAIGFRFHSSPPAALLVLPVAVSFGIPFSWIAALIGTSVRDPETVQVAGFIWLFPLAFVSSAFVPVDTMPSWLRPVAEANPFTVAVDSLRALSQGGDAHASLIKMVLWIVGITVVAAPLAVRAYRRA
jgi:ABC-2 type transport system permease protein